MLRVGLTGGIGSGKSTVADFFSAHGIPLIDTDEIARDLVEPGQAAHVEIAQRFGTDVLDAHGRLDRAKMRDLVFRDPGKRKLLEAILHPRIRDEVKTRLSALAAPYAIVAVPLLLETGFDDLVDRILVVDCDEALQIQRASARSGLTEEEVRRVMATQASRQQRLARADDVIENNADMARLQQDVNRLHERYLALARN
jgi:dephospho-CoA kinase